MRTAILATAALLMLVSAANAQAPETFAEAKRLLAGIHEDIGHLRTLYCGCPYVRKGRSGGDIDRDACVLDARPRAVREVGRNAVQGPEVLHQT